MVLTTLSSISFVATLKPILILPGHTTPQVRHHTLQITVTMKPSLQTRTKLASGQVIVQRFTIQMGARSFTLRLIRVLHN